MYPEDDWQVLCVRWRINVENLTRMSSLNVGNISNHALGVCTREQEGIEKDAEQRYFHGGFSIELNREIMRTEISYP